MGGGQLVDIDANIDKSPTEAKTIFDQTVTELAQRFKWSDAQKSDRSSLDHAVVVSLRHHGFDEREVAAVLLHGSAKAAERGVEYVMRTVAAVFGDGVR